MKLIDCLNAVSQTSSANKCDVRFWENRSLEEPPIHVTTMNIAELYKDWWGECNNCPENDTFIYAIEFSTHNGRTFFVDNAGYQDFTFEELMEAIKKQFFNY